MMIPIPDPNLKYQYLTILCRDNGSDYGGYSIESAIELFKTKGWIYKGKDLGYPYKLYFEYPKTNFDLAFFSMFENMGNIL